MKGVVMEIRITLRHLEISEEIKKLITRKVGKLQKYDPDIQLIEIIITQEKFRHRVEILIKSRHFQMEASGQHGNLQTCFDDVLAKIERRLIEHKKRFKDKKHRKTAPSPESADDET
ncbi:MAG: ribosome-associated translation inhibitor RaiA [Candidatus Sumerlaeota bacterium]|nr:ribosome-associated translation inhibitor RaiA [Candidatus Sumerlaeota bacterium]